MRVFVIIALFQYMLSAATAQVYTITVMAYSDANCSADGRLFGYIPLASLGISSCNSLSSPICVLDSYSGSYIKYTACAEGSPPTPTSGLWQSVYSSSSCTASSLRFMAQTPSACAAGSGISQRAICTNSGGAQRLTYPNTLCSGSPDRSEDVVRGMNSTLGTCAYSSSLGYYSIVSCYETPSVPFSPTQGIWQENFKSSSCAPSSSYTMSQTYSGICRLAGPGAGPGSYVKAACTTSGSAQVEYYSTATCSGSPIYFYDFSSSSTPIGACQSSGYGSQGESYKYSCYGTGAPFSLLAALSGKTCGGAPLPSSASLSGISCYSGIVAAGGGRVYEHPSTMIGPSGTPITFKVCGAVTGTVDGSMNMSGMIVGQRVRMYFPILNLDSVNLRSVTMGFSDVTDVTMCTSNKCNSPATDACATAGGALPALTSPVCGGAPTSSVPLSVTAAPISCFNNVNAPLALQAAPVGGLCVALTRLCKGANDTLPNCAGRSAGTAVRVYSDVNTLLITLGSAAANALFSTFAEFYRGMLMTHGSSILADLSELTLCNAAGW
jgi:hypothetical protein